MARRKRQSVKKSIRLAARLYRSFREREPDRVASVRIKLPKVAVVMGHLRRIDYDTTHGKREQPYKHFFRGSSRPLLCAGTSDGQLLIVGGRYRVTGRGIVNLSPKRREES